MALVFLSPIGGAGAQFFDDNGVPLAGGLLYTYAAGTTSPSPSYIESTGTTLHTNPIVLDAGGRVPSGGEVWIPQGAYLKFVMTTPTGVTLATWDGISGVNDPLSLIGAVSTQYAASNGSSLVGFIASGTYPIPRTVQDKLRDVVNVKDFGAVGDGVIDDTAAIQHAVDASLVVRIPAGNYRILGVIMLRAGSCIVGDGVEATTLFRDAVGANGRGLFTSDSGSSTTSLSGITIQDLTVYGKSDTLGFSEFQHLISLNGVDNATVERVKFRGFRGDGLYIGSGFGTGVERHNTNVKVIGCVFDGINNMNRNALSCIDIDGLLVIGCSFTNCTSSTMPGAIDLEPDNQSFHIIRNATIYGNTFVNIGGNTGAVGVAIPAVVAEPTNIRIIGNAFTTVNVPFFVALNRAVSATSKDSDIVFSQNNVNGFNRPFTIYGTRGIDIADNVFTSGIGTALVGADSTTSGLFDTRILRNKFHNCASTSGILIQIYSVVGLVISDNLFDSCGSGSGTSYVMFFSGGSIVSVGTSYVTLQGNRVYPGGMSSHAVVKSPSHSFSTSTNYENGNEWGGLANGFDTQRQYTPRIEGLTTAGTGTYTSQIGEYTLVGKMCTVFAYIDWSAHTGTGVLKFTLPFMAASRGLLSFTGSSRLHNITYTGSYLTPYVSGGSDYALFLQNAPNTAASNLTMDAAGAITMSITYEIA